MKRVRISSHENRSRVFLSLPTTEVNKRYRVTAESLVVPCLNSHVLNDHLFTVERRLEANGAAADVSLLHSEFTAKNVRTTSQLVWQMNMFFHEMLLRNVASEYDDQKDNGFYDVPDSFQDEKTRSNEVDDNEGAVTGALRASIRPDGKVGFYWTGDAATVLVIRLTERGRYVFGETASFLAPSMDGTTLTFNQYDVQESQVGFTELHGSDASTITDTVGHACPNSVFSNVRHRSELVVHTDLPFPSKMVCDGSKSHVEHEFASYQFPHSEPSFTYRGRDRWIEETNEVVHVFEDSGRTHNSFIVQGTDLQNFTVSLHERFKDPDQHGTLQFKTNPYEMANGRYFTLQLVIQQVS